MCIRDSFACAVHAVRQNCAVPWAAPESPWDELVSGWISQPAARIASAESARTSEAAEEGAMGASKARDVPTSSRAARMGCALRVPDVRTALKVR